MDGAMVLLGPGGGGSRAWSTAIRTENGALLAAIFVDTRERDIGLVREARAQGRADQVRSRPATTPPGAVSSNT